MTDVVTNTAAYVQPLLYANRQQALGIPSSESPQVDLALAAANSQQQQALDLTQVPQTSDDRSSPKQGSDGSGQPANQSFAGQLPTSSLAAKATEFSPTTGPAKARVDIPVFDITALAAKPESSTPGSSASAQVPVPPSPAPQDAETQPSPAGVTLANVAGGPAGPAPQPSEPAAQPPVQSSGILGPAAQIKDADLAVISANIFGAAFAPTQLGQVGSSGSPNQTQKNFIFAQRKLFADAEVSALSSGKFAATSATAAATTAGSRFAVSATVAQQLSDKVTAAATSVAAANSATPSSAAAPRASSSAGSHPSDSSVDARESLYQRAQAVAQAFGEKSSNPAVKHLVATLESYALVAGISSGVKTPAGSTVRVTV